MTTPSDRWVAGDAYESFMGRWSGEVAEQFLAWLAVPPGAHWLDVGCGTGALSRTVCRTCQPGTMVGCDPAPDFVSFAQRAVTDCPATFLVAAADSLPSREEGFDVVVSGLVLNFLPQPLRSVHSMVERLRPGGLLAAYVWDYLDGMRFLRMFWDEAVALDAAAADRDEGRRFPLCHPDRLALLFREAKMIDVATTALPIETVFPTFDDFWSPFLRGTGPAPSYVASLSDEGRDQLASRLKARLATPTGGPIRLTARAIGVRGVRSR